MKWLYHCPSCGADYEIEPSRYLCDTCSTENAPGKPLHGVLECAWTGTPEAFMPALAKGSVIPLPVPSEFFPSIPVGDTPLWASERLRKETGFPNLFLKDDTCNPSGSFKDRASYLVAAFARQRGIKEIALASTGNAASSMAAVGAAAGLKITVFLPVAAPIAKRIQVLQYGAELVEVQGNYDMAFDQSLEYSRQTGTLSRNTAYNPLTIEGKKTASFEIVAELGRGPDHVFVPTGDGVIIAGVIKGFEDLVKLGLIDKMPTVWAAQAEKSSAIARALAVVAPMGIELAGTEFKGADPFEPVIPATTLADSISVDAPRNGPFALAKLLKHGGRAATVSDEEILEAQVFVSSRSGLFAEPSSATAFAAFMKVRATLDPDETVVIMLTGSGLKDIKNAARAVEGRTHHD